LRVVETLNLSFSYDGKEVLKKINFGLEKGTINILVGPNGAGKSTLIRILSGILTPSSGDVKIEGKSLFTLSREEIARKISYLPQETHVVYPFTCLEIVLMGRVPWTGRWGKERLEDLEIAEEAMKRIGILNLRGRPITEVSGGERQLVFLARAISQKTDIFLLDEPASHLDMRHKFVLFDVLHHLREDGKSILLVTHDFFLLQFPFDNLLAMKEGEIIASGKREELLNEPLLTKLYGVPLRLEKRDKNFILIPKVLK
jgi:iron complex transport system ATP-binding protein